MASGSRFSIDTYNINDLDIDLEKHLDHFTFEPIMDTVSIDTKYLYRDVTSVNFDPLLAKVEQDGVERIRHFYLPGEKVTLIDEYSESRCGIEEDGKTYTDLASQMTKLATVENIYAPYARCANDVKYLTDALINGVHGNVKVYFPNAECKEGIKMEDLFPELSKNVTIFLPPVWEFAIKNHRRYMHVMDKKVASQALRAKSGKPIALMHFQGGYASHDVGVTSLFSDTTASTNLFFQDHAYKFLHVEETLKSINEIKTQRSQEDPRSTEPNIVIGVLDSGLMGNHQAFGPTGRILALKNFIPTPTGGEEPMDCGESDLYADRNGHGTFCVSIAAGERFKASCGPPDNRQPFAQDRWLTGVAPFAKIVLGKVVAPDNDGTVKPEWVANGLRWILDLDGTDKKVDIIFLSLGFPTYHADLRNVISEANIKGKIIICAASNDGRRQQTNIAFPARFGDVICVGSHNSNGQPSASSPTGREIDFMAPGEDVWGASSAYEDAAVPMSGTSVATPFVAGIAAIVLKAAHHIGGDDLRQKVSNTTVMREVLRKMASMPGRHDETMGYGNLNPYRVFRYGEDYFRKIVKEIYE